MGRPIKGGHRSEVTGSWCGGQFLTAYVRHGKPSQWHKAGTVCRRCGQFTFALEVPGRVPLRPPGWDADLEVFHLCGHPPWALIQAAYRLLAQAHHPDHGGDTARMKGLNIAYEILRRRYKE